MTTYFINIHLTPLSHPKLSSTLEKLKRQLHLSQEAHWQCTFHFKQIRKKKVHHYFGIQNCNSIIVAYIFKKQRMLETLPQWSLLLWLTSTWQRQINTQRHMCTQAYVCGCKRKMSSRNKILFRKWSFH